MKRQREEEENPDDDKKTKLLCPSTAAILDLRAGPEVAFLSKLT